MKIKVVVFTTWFWPAFRAGGPIQSLINLVVQLKDELELSVICSNKDLDGSVLPVLQNRWVKELETSIFYCEGILMKNPLKINAGPYVYFINGIYSFRYNFIPILFATGRRIISTRGMLHPEALEQKQLKKRIYLFLLKFMHIHKRCEFHATSEAEKIYIQSVFGQSSHVWVIQNLPNLQNCTTLPKKQKGSLVMCTIALISPMKNFLPVLKALKQSGSSIVYNIYGPIKDKAYWDQCLNEISTMPRNVEVKYHGEISHDLISGKLAMCHIYIQPSRSENFGHSLIEALSSGRPIITSNSTPWNNLKQSQAGMNIDPDKLHELKNAIEHFVTMSETEMNCWSTAAKQYSMQALNIEAVKDQYVAMFTHSNKWKEI